MPRKFKYKFTRKESDYDKYSKKLSPRHKRLLLGTTDVIRHGIDALEVNVTRNVIKMFYVYVKIKLQEGDQREGELKEIYTFINKYVFAEPSELAYFKEYDIDELKNLFTQCYEVFVKDTRDDDTLGIKIRKITSSGELDYHSIFEQKMRIIQLVLNYIDFLFLHYISKTLNMDHPLGLAIAKSYIEKSTRNLEKQTNIDILKRGVTQRVIEIKVSFLEQTIITVERDLKAYLSDAKYDNVKTEVLDEYNEYHGKLNESLHLKYDLAGKIRTHKVLFESMNELGMNWVCNCANVNGGNSEYFYVYIYDLIMYKYRLLAYLLLNEYNIKTKQEVLDSLEKIESYDKDEMAYDFFTRNIRSAEDINAHIIKLFEKKYQKFIKTILAVGTRTPYEKSVVTPTFFSLVDMPFKHEPLASLKYFPIMITAKEYLKYRNL